MFPSLIKKLKQLTPALPKQYEMEAIDTKLQELKSQISKNKTFDYDAQICLAEYNLVEISSHINLWVTFTQFIALICLIYTYFNAEFLSLLITLVVGGFVVARRVILERELNKIKREILVLKLAKEQTKNHTPVNQ